MRRTQSATKTTAIPNEDHPQPVKRAKRILIVVVLVFVLSGVSGIAGFLCVLMPQQYAQQIDADYTATLRAANAGDSIFFGTYEQDNDLSDGAETIEWIVLSKEGNRLLLVSRYALDCAPFNTGSRISTWDSSAMLRWLNESFFLTAFSPAEQTIVRLSEVTPDKNAFCSTDPGKLTKCRVFLLSLNEAIRYLQNTDDRLCRPTPYAVAHGARVLDNGACGWWLRSPGYDVSATTRVLADGEFSLVGQPANRSNAVRPAIWVEYREAENV